MSEKEKIDLDKVPKYKNNVSQNLEGVKQSQKKIEAACSQVSNSQLKKFENELNERNTYFARSKIPEVNEQDQLFKMTKMTNKFKGDLNSINQEDNGYCPKCPSHKNHCPHKNQKEQLKDKFSYPIVSNSVYGWLPPIDTLRDNHNLNSNTKSFFDNSHL